MQTANRFSTLKSPNNTRNSREKSTPLEYKVNTFKQRPPLKSQNRERTNKVLTGNNLFRKQKQSKQTPIEFSINSENFPELNKPVDNLQNNLQNNYLEKIKQTKLEAEKREPIKSDWVILRKGNYQKPSQNFSQKSSQYTDSSYYNLLLARQILYDRQKHRDELNEILGDISPYWNLNFDNDEEDDDYYEYDDDDDDDDEYYDETY